MSGLIGETLKKSYFIFSSYCPLQMWPMITCNKDISKNISASSFKLGLLIEDDG